MLSKFTIDGITVLAPTYADAVRIVRGRPYAADVAPLTLRTVYR